MFTRDCIKKPTFFQYDKKETDPTFNEIEEELKLKEKKKNVILETQKCCSLVYNIRLSLPQQDRFFYVNDFTLCKDLSVEIMKLMKYPQTFMDCVEEGRVLLDEIQI